MTDKGRAFALAQVQRGFLQPPRGPAAPEDHMPLTCTLAIRRRCPCQLQIQLPSPVSPVNSRLKTREATVGKQHERSTDYMMSLLVNIIAAVEELRETKSLRQATFVSG